MARSCGCSKVGDSTLHLNEVCCYKSNLRGIKKLRTTENITIYFADTVLVCDECSGSDSDIEYTWELKPVKGNVMIVSPETQIGNNMVEVKGTGIFYLEVKVTFQCQRGVFNFTCSRNASEKFAQGSKSNGVK